MHSHIHQTATLVAAYLTYLLGDELGFSGVIAVVACGFITAQAASDWIGPDRREELNRFWEYIGFLANSLIFLLVGITIASLEDLSLLIKGGILGIFFLIGAVLLARLVPVIGTFAIFNRFTKHKVPFSYQAICFWGGLRGLWLLPWFFLSHFLCHFGISLLHSPSLQYCYDFCRGYDHWAPYSVSWPWTVKIAPNISPIIWRTCYIQGGTIQS